MRIVRNYWLAAALATAAAAPASIALAADSAERNFQEAYFQQTYEHNPARAATLYEQVVADPGAAAALRDEAKSRLAECQEDQAADHFAQLMPADALAYVEISRPGDQAGKLLQMLGLIRTPGEISHGPEAGAQTTFGPGFALPEKFGVDPALVRELGKIRGAAVALTGISPNGEPSGVAVVHLGDCDLARGLVGTGIQILPQAELIAGFQVYQVEGRVWIATTKRLLIASGSRDQVAQTVERLKGASVESLATLPEFKRLEADRSGALLTAFVNGRRALEVVGPQLHGQEAAMVRTALDLDHLATMSATIGVTEPGLQATVKAAFAEGHHNLAYSIVRTAPLTRKSLDHVPAGTAAIALLGLNPAGPANPAGAPGGVTAMDIGREVFANVEELGLFVLPGSGEGPRAMPEVGVVAAVKDPAKSEALWDQLLSLAALFGPQVAGPPQKIEISGHAARQYQFNGAPPIVVVRLGDGAIAVGTRGAVTAALDVEKSGSIAKDPQFQPLLAGLRPESSKAVLVHAGRMMTVGQAAGGPSELRQIATLIGDLRLMVATHELPNEFAVQASASGLPNVPSIVRAAMTHHGPQPPVAARSVPVRRIAVPAAPVAPPVPVAPVTVAPAAVAPSTK
jgi:hypothetical protein